MSDNKPLNLTLPTYTLVLTPQGLAAISAGLAELKYGVAKQWLDIIEAQVRQQQAAADMPVAKPAPVKAKGVKAG